jgi:hypothetical protein
VDSEAAGRAVEPARAAPHRPVPVTVLAIIQFVLGVNYLLGGAGLAMDPELATATGLVDRSAFALVEDEALAAAYLLLGLVELTSAVLLLRLRRAGWTLAMLLAGVSLLLQIVGYVANGTLTTLSLGLHVVSVLYLNQRQVREAFGLVPLGRTTLAEERG